VTYHIVNKLIIRRVIIISFLLFFVVAMVEWTSLALRSIGVIIVARFFGPTCSYCLLMQLFSVSSVIIYVSVDELMLVMLALHLLFTLSRDGCTCSQIQGSFPALF